MNSRQAVFGRRRSGRRDGQTHGMTRAGLLQSRGVVRPYFRRRAPNGSRACRRSTGAPDSGVPAVSSPSTR